MPAEGSKAAAVTPQEMLNRAERLRIKADESNDSHDHDELHAASEVAFIIATIHPDMRNNSYIKRWLEGLDA